MLKKITAESLKDCIEDLKKDENKNRFILYNMDGLKLGEHYFLYKSSTTHILYIPSLLISLSAATSLDDDAISFIREHDFRMLLAPGLSEINVDGVKSKRIETLMVKERCEEKEEAVIIKRLKDYLSLVSFYNSIEGMDHFYSEKDMVRKYKERSDNNFFSVIFEDEMVVSALYVSKNIISNVATQKDKRCFGYASKNIKSALNYYFKKNEKENKIFLFTKGEKLINFYASLGFKKVEDILIIKR